ncbi:RNA polymerase sigma factor [Clostridium botulinum]|uniref:sigma-70 family RNA polymerase sigma factor n=1 Tax=Clostridium botulinum TaxID=1491 RepID=UPI00069B8046|nr:sigma-70 family RNA polymerase sigma factor [Clostridium botulinum]KOA78096.1 RNA polymerase sigma factor [Clostridium botulinum]NFF61134.1 sigma-70 family RNA polymerase sigma factor [Clostridium botulinum]
MEEVIRKARGGDVKSINSIINKYKNFVFKKAAGYNIPGYDFEDLVQHGYLSIIKAIRMYRLGSSSYNGYFLNAISTNFAALLKGEIKHFREVPDDNILNKDEEYEFTVEDEVIVYDQVKKLYEAMDKLQPLEREIISRYYINDESFKDIANDKKLLYDRTTYLRRRAIRKLRGMMENKGFI